MSPNEMQWFGLNIRHSDSSHRNGRQDYKPHLLSNHIPQKIYGGICLYMPYPQLISVHKMRNSNVSHHSLLIPAWRHWSLYKPMLPRCYQVKVKTVYHSIIFSKISKSDAAYIFQSASWLHFVLSNVFKLKHWIILYILNHIGNQWKTNFPTRALAIRQLWTPEMDIMRFQPPHSSMYSSGVCNACNVIHGLN